MSYYAVVHTDRGIYAQTAFIQAENASQAIAEFVRAHLPGGERQSDELSARRMGLFETVTFAIHNPVPCNENGAK